MRGALGGRVSTEGDLDVFKFLKTGASVAAALAVLALTLMLAGCGDSAADKTKDAAKSEDAAFLVASVALNENAIEMSKLVAKRGESKALKTFAATVVGHRTEELAEIKKYAGQVDADTGAAPTEEQLETLGWSEKDIYLDADAEELDKASDANFDAVYLKLLLENNDGAIRVARPQVIKGGADEIVTLAQKLISARSLEIEEAEQQQRRLAR